MTDIVERLRNTARVIQGGDTTVAYIPSICENAAEEIERLRDILRQCVKGPNAVDIGGETIGLHLMGDGESFADIRAKAKRMPSSEFGEPS